MRRGGYSQQELLKITRDCLLAGTFQLGDWTGIQDQVLINIKPATWVAWMNSLREALDKLETALVPEIARERRRSLVSNVHPRPLALAPALGGSAPRSRDVRSAVEGSQPSGKNVHRG